MEHRLKPEEKKQKNEGVRERRAERERDRDRRGERKMGEKKEQNVQGKNRLVVQLQIGDDLRLTLRQRKAFIGQCGGGNQPKAFCPMAFPVSHPG